VHSVAYLEAEIDRLGSEIDRLNAENTLLKAEQGRTVEGIRKALGLVREAGDCLLAMAPDHAKSRIWEAARLLLDLGGGAHAAH
jgi:hypothetical protein